MYSGVNNCEILYYFAGGKLPVDLKGGEVYFGRQSVIGPNDILRSAAKVSKIVKIKGKFPIPDVPHLCRRAVALMDLPCMYVIVFC